MKKTLFLLLLAIVITAGCTTQSNTIQSSTDSSGQKSVSAKVEKSKLTDKVDVKLINKGFQAADIYKGTYQDYITMKFELTNKTGKDVKGVQGNTIFYDIFDNQIYQSTFSYDQGIVANGTATWDASMEYNQFMDDHQKLKTTDLENLRLEWVPEVIIYSDGTREEK